MNKIITRLCSVILSCLCLVLVLILATTQVTRAQEPPPRPEIPVPPQPQPSLGEDDKARIELRAVPDGAYTIVQWQGGNGGWQDVEGWYIRARGDTVRWVVEEKDYDKGPFRWLAYHYGGTVIGISDLFLLPSKGQTVKVILNRIPDQENSIYVYDNYHNPMYRYERPAPQYDPRQLFFREYKYTLESYAPALPPLSYQPQDQQQLQPQYKGDIEKADHDSENRNGKEANEATGGDDANKGNGDDVVVHYYELGLDALVDGDLREAIESFSKAIELDPKPYKAFYNRGLAYLLQAEYEKAIDDFDRAILRNPELDAAYYNRDLAYDALDNNDDRE